MQSVYRVDSSTAAMLPSFVTRDSFLLKPPLRKQLIRSHFEVVLVRFVRVSRWAEDMPAHPGSFLKYDEWCVVISLALDNAQKHEAGSRE